MVSGHVVSERLHPCAATIASVSPGVTNPALADTEKLALFDTLQARLLEEQRQAPDEKIAEDSWCRGLSHYM